MASDSANELDLIKFRKKIGKAWPRSVHVHQNEKAKCHRQINRLTIHLQEQKRSNRKYMGRRAGEIPDRDL